MSAIEAARNHFQSLGRRRVEVPEWGHEGAPLVITFTPLTLAEHRKVFPPGKERDLSCYPALLILKAEDEAGKKLFTGADEPVLRTGVDAFVVGRIATAMLDIPTVAEAVGN